MTAKSDGFGSVACRLAKNHYDVDEDNSHIHVNQDIARNRYGKAIGASVSGARVFRGVRWHYFRGVRSVSGVWHLSGGCCARLA